MGSDDRVLSGSVGNLMGLITELYRVMFAHVAKTSIEPEELSVYVNNFKFISTKLLGKPSIFQHHMQSISFLNDRVDDASIDSPSLCETVFLIPAAL